MVGSVHVAQRSMHSRRSLERIEMHGTERAGGAVGMRQTSASQSRKNARRAVLVWGIPVLLVILLVFANSPWWLAVIAILWLLIIWGVSSSERNKAARRRAARVHSRSRPTGVVPVSQRWEADPRGRNRL